MTTENPDKNPGQEMIVFEERLKKVKERLVEVEQLAESKGLSSEFIHNATQNIISEVPMGLEILKEESDTEMRNMVEENLDLAKKYLDTLNKNEEALRIEGSMTFETWSKMGQQERDHALGIIEKYKV